MKILRQANVQRRKTHKISLEIKDKNKRDDKSDNTTGRNNSDIDERRETQKILGQGQAIQTK